MIGGRLLSGDARPHDGEDVECVLALQSPSQVQERGGQAEPRHSARVRLQSQLGEETLRQQSDIERVGFD